MRGVAAWRLGGPGRPDCRRARRLRALLFLEAHHHLKRLRVAKADRQIRGPSFKMTRAEQGPQEVDVAASQPHVIQGPLTAQIANVRSPVRQFLGELCANGLRDVQRRYREAASELAVPGAPPRARPVDHGVGWRSQICWLRRRRSRTPGATDTVADSRCSAAETAHDSRGHTVRRIRQDL